MRNWMWTAVSTVAIFTIGGVIGCFPPPGDDDDDSPTPATTPEPGDSPTPEPARISVSGTIYAVDAETGVELSWEEYQSRAGSIVVYALKDPDNLVYPLGKATLAGPGYYEMDVVEDSGPIYVVAVADFDFNTVITSYDVARIAPTSPVTVETSPIIGVDVTLDLGQHGGGGVGPDVTTFSGGVTYTGKNADTTNIAVVAFRGDYASFVYGMTTRVGSGEYSTSIGVYSDSTSLLGYADADNNGLYEPCDPAGLAEDNPYQLTTNGGSSVDILIEGVGPGGLPQPIPYVAVSGSVVVDDGYTGTPIQVTLTSAMDDTEYAAVTLGGAGNFSFRVPGELSQLVLTASTDSNGDGILDPEEDAITSYGPFDLGTSSLGGITLTLIRPVIPDTGVTGTITYSGALGENDRVVIGVFTDPTMVSGPVLPLAYFPATFPLTYKIVDFDTVLESLGATTATFYVAASLDVNGDMGSAGPDQYDITSGYSTDGTNLKGIDVEEGQVVEGIDISLDH